MSTPANVDRVESDANITLTVSFGADVQGDGNPPQTIRVPISRLDRTKDIEISEIRESSLKATGYSITAISFSGSMMFKGYKVSGPDGNTVRLEDLLFDEDGVPRPCTLSITHELTDDTETFEDVLATSESYEVQNESETETAYDWIAMDKN